MARKILYACIVLFACFQSPAQEWDWMHRFGGDFSSVNAVALDRQNNVYVAGTFSGSNTFGSNVFLSSGGADVFVAKLSEQGEVIWAVAAGGTDEDSINHLVSTSNGVVFVTGNFDLLANPSGPITNVQVARVENGVFTWTDTFSNAAVNGIALGPDETPWVVGVNTQVFIRHYRVDGTVQGTFTVGNSLFYPNAIAVNHLGEPFITAAFAGTVDLGTTNITSSWGREYFTAALTPQGRVRWAWRKFRFYSGYEPLTDLKTTPDNEVATIGFWDSGLPQGRLMVTKHSDAGVQEWRVDRTGGHKSIYQASALTVDQHGYLHLVGHVVDALRGSYRWNGIGVWAFSPTGNLVSEEFITCGRSFDALAGNGIAVDKQGNTVIGGLLSGRPRFGTNNFSGFIATTNGFVARRATVEPVLAIQRTTTNATIDWPRTGAPFALQQATALDSNAWADLAIPPTVTGERARVSLSSNPNMNFFRLRRTNELINVLPELIGFAVSPATQLPDGRWIVTTDSDAATNVTITTWNKDWNYDNVSVIWYDQTGTNRLNYAITGTSYLAISDGEESEVYVSTLNEPGLAFPVGTNTVLAVASDHYQSSTTNAFTFEVVRNQ